MQQVTVLGSTGSIGDSTLDVITRHADKYCVYALTANTQVDKLMQQCMVHKPKYAVMRDQLSAQLLTTRLRELELPTQVLAGEEGLKTVAAAAEVDVVMAAIVGAAGLVPTLAAVEAGKKVLLANKESLVMAGDLFIAAVKQSGTVLLPIDSEHNAIFQCMPAGYSSMAAAGVKRILLTASGGPFRKFTTEQLATVTPAQACAHPNWSMGRKISVDSATLMNKGLELIEACWLFDTTPDHVEIVVHPQSVIHSMVEYVDGSVLAQMGNPDMRTPIAHALAWPTRIESGVSSLDVIATARLDFEAPDEQRFPCLRLAREAFDAGKSAVVVLNAANEIAVEAFLNGRISFNKIPEIIAQVLDNVTLTEPTSLAVVQQMDQIARVAAEEMILRI